MFDGNEGQDLPPTPATTASDGEEQQLDLPPTPTTPTTVNDEEEQMDLPPTPTTTASPSDEEEEEEQMDLPPTPATSSSRDEGQPQRQASDLADPLPPTPKTPASCSTSAGDDADEEQLRSRSRSSPPDTEALRAVSEYQDAVRRKLVDDALQGSSQCVATAVQALIDSHAEDLRQQEEENGALRAQLLRATGLIGQLSDRLAAVKSLGEGTWTTATAATPAVGHHTPHGTQEMVPGTQSTAAAEESIPHALPAADAHDNVVLCPSPPAVAALLADFKALRGLSATLEGENRRWRSHFTELSALLAAVTQENVEHRKELARLRTGTVALAQYQDAVQARDAAAHELGQLRAQAAKLAEQLDTTAQLRTFSGAFAEEEEGEADADADACERAVAMAVGRRTPGAAVAGVDDGDAPDAAPHEGMWAQALREMNEQAALAANHAATRDRLAAVEAQLDALTTEHAHLTAAMAALKEEDEALRLDAQQLTYRNGVLSQQVTSLLVKVEGLRRASAHQHTDDGTPADVGRSSGDGQQQQQQRLSSPAGPWRAGAVRTAVAASVLAEQRRHVRGGAAALAALPGNRTAGASGVDSTFAGSAVQSPVGAGADATLPPHTPPRAYASSETLLSSGALDVCASVVGGPRAPAPLPTLEMAQGVRRSLSTYSSRRRSVAMRRFGCAQVEVDLPCEPRLPACDQLSGVPLGQPSCYSVLDPVRGTVQRIGSAAELTLVHSSPSASPAHHPSGSSRGDGTTLSEGGETEVRNLLEMLDMIDADDQLGRYSVNSVAELVVRNQELLQQLYSTEQRAETAETRLAATLSHDAGTDTAAEPSGRHTADRALASQQQRKRSRGGDVAREGAAPSSGRHDTTTASSSGAFTTRVSGVGGAAGEPAPLAAPARDPSDVVVASQGLPTQMAEGDEGDDEQQRQRSLAAAAPWASAVIGSQVLSESVQAAVRQLVESSLRQHDAMVSHLDEGLAASLLQLLESKALSASATPQHRLHSFLLDADSTLLASLVSLCTSQAATLAQQSIELAAAQTAGMEKGHRAGWAQAQQLLQSTADDLKSAITRAAEEAREAATACSRDRDDCAGAVSGAGGGDGGVFGQAASLAQVLELLQTASEKESTVQRVHTMAQTRQREFIEKKERRLARLAARVERAAAALTTMVAHLQQHRRAQRSASPLAAPSDGADAVAASSAVQGPHSPNTTAATPLQLPLPDGAVPTTPPLGSSSGGPWPTVEMLLSLPGVRDRGAGVVISQVPYMVVADDSDADDADDAAAFEELRDRLALAQAQSEQLAGELHEEKTAHMDLYDRMWKLEIERDEAVAERERTATAMSTMLKREEYESVIADLDEANNTIADRDAQLVRGQEQNSKLATEIDLLKERLASHQQRHEHADAAKNEEIERRGRELEDQGRRYNRLYAQNRQLEEEALALRQDAQTSASIAARDALHIHRLKEQLAEVKEQFLATDDTQQVLMALYPGDTALAAHAAMVVKMREERRGLEERLHKLRLQLRQTEELLGERTAELRRAVQERQAAEVRVQELLLSRGGGTTTATTTTTAATTFDVAAAAVAGGDDDGVRPGAKRPRTEGEEEGRREASGNDDDDADDAEDGVEGPRRRPQLEHRVRELQVALEAQDRELTLLRGSAAAWKVREAEMRQHIDRLGRDPVSETARKYGLAECVSFEGQIHEVAERNDALTESVDSLTRQKAELEADARRASDQLRAAEEKAVALQAALDSSTASAAATEAALQTARDELAALQVRQAEAQRTVEGGQRDLAAQREQQAALERRVAEAERALQQCRADRDKFYSDNRQLIDRVQALQQEVQQADAGQRAARAALAQGLAMREPGGAAGRHGRGPSTARRLLRNTAVFAPASSNNNNNSSSGSGSGGGGGGGSTLFGGAINATSMSFNSQSGWSSGGGFSP